LKEYLEKNPDKYYREIAEKFGIKKFQIYNLLHRIGFTHKKYFIKRFTWRVNYNMSIHKIEKLKILVENAWHKMFFLLPYSPDLNLIEHKLYESKSKSFYDNASNFMHK